MFSNRYLVFVGNKNEVFVGNKNEVFVGNKNEVGVSSVIRLVFFDISDGKYSLFAYSPSWLKIPQPRGTSAPAARYCFCSS